MVVGLSCELLQTAMPAAVTAAQQQEYEEKGWVVLPSVFDAGQIAVLEEAALEVLERPGPEVGRETGGRPTIMWGAHLFSGVLRALSRHPDVLAPARQLLGRDIYVHQSRINLKQTKGAVVDWHQDFGTYHRVDGLPRPDGIMIAVFLDRVTELNAPLLAVPGSHREGLVPLVYRDKDGKRREDRGIHTFDDLQAPSDGAAEEGGYAAGGVEVDDATDEDRLTATYSDFSGFIDEGVMRDLVARRGLESITAAAGSLLLMKINVVHGSTINMSPSRRLTLFLNVCSVDNKPDPATPRRRPHYYAAREYEPLKSLGPGCLYDAAAAEAGPRL